MNNMRIEICGGIASGKTTLAQILQNYNINTLFENFYDNPFWKEFYKDPDYYSFETEITFLLIHYNQIKNNLINSNLFVSDFSLLLDKSYADFTLDNFTQIPFFSVFDEVKRQIGLPEFLIYLQCTSDVEYERIRKRARSPEQLISINYLQELNENIEKNIAEVESNNACKVIKIRSDINDFLHYDETKRQITDYIMNFIN